MINNKTILLAALMATAAAGTPVTSTFRSNLPSPKPPKAPDSERIQKAQAKRDRKAAKRATKEASNAG